MLSTSRCFSISAQNFIEKRFKIIWPLFIYYSLINLYSRVYNHFLSKGSMPLYIGLTFADFRVGINAIINATFLKLLLFGLFIQICQQVSLSLKHDNVTRTFLLICLVSETWSDHYLLPKVLIKIRFLVPS